MRVIWSIDAFEDNKELNQKMADYVTHLHKTCGAEIEPLYLLRENEIVLPTYEVPAWVEDHSRTAEALFREVLSDYNLPFLKEPKVLPHASQSHAGAAETLSEYARRTNTDMIVVGSHAREGFQRFILGSFAESLLLQCETPVCVISSRAANTHSSKRVLFPTDFGDHAKENFRHALNLAQSLNAEIVILHAITRPIESLFDMETRPRVYNYEGQMMSLEQILDAQVELQAQKAQQWVEWAHIEGVEASFQIDSTFKPVDELVLAALGAHDCDMVMMEAQSGAISAALLGSYTRNVVRHAPCPVYVLPRHFYDHSHQRASEQTSPPPF